MERGGAVSCAGGGGLGQFMPSRPILVKTLNLRRSRKRANAQAYAELRPNKAERFPQQRKGEVKLDRLHLVTYTGYASLTLIT